MSEHRPHVGTCDEGTSCDDCGCCSHCPENCKACVLHGLPTAAICRSSSRGCICEGDAQ